MQIQKFAEPMKHIANYHFGTVRNLFLGASLCFAVQKEKYGHLPAILFFPSIYAGYNLFENKDDVVKWLKTFRTEVSKTLL